LIGGEDKTVENGGIVTTATTRINENNVPKNNK
jgi:hypothetical protein